jgi:xylulose-5-phosphate/fructose-6-phosphate phosphoketolase
MAVLNELDRYHLALAALKYLPDMGKPKEVLAANLNAKLEEHFRYVRANGEDMPEIQNWCWTSRPTD